MVSLQKIDDSAVKFVFTDSDHYLYGNGEVVIPVNSLSLVIDESEMVTFKKSATGDPFISFRADNSNLGTKEAIEQFYKENMVGAGGISEEEVQDMIDAATSGMPSSQVVEQLRTDLNTVSGDVSNLQGETQGIWDTIDEKEEVIASALTQLNQDVADIDAKEEVISSALTEVNQALNNKLDASAYTPTDLSEYWTSAQTQTAIDGVKAYFIDLDTIMQRGLTDADWDGAIAAVNAHRPVYIKFYNNHYILESYSLDNTMNGDAMYLSASDGIAASKFTIIKNGSNDYSLQRNIRNFVTDADKTAWNAKQDALSAGTGIEISGNVISATGGGGATYSAGTNISIDAANTINCTLNLQNGSATGQGSIVIAPYGTTASGNRALAGGMLASAGGEESIAYGAHAKTNINAGSSFALGSYVETKNMNETSLGYYNKTNKKNYTFGDSGNTLFSVGNGTEENARHNAFEIRQNGDIYVNDGTNDVKLQDTITATTANTTALGGLKLVKLSQSEYDALSTKDANTLYIISNVVS